MLRTRFHLPLLKTENPHFDVAQWYRRRVRRLRVGIFDDPDEASIGETLCRLFEAAEDGQGTINAIELHHVRLTQSRFAIIQRNAAITRDFRWTIPKPVVVITHVNGQPARALIDAGSLADCVSLTLVDQLKLEHVMLEKPLTIQLSVQGSQQSKVNFGVKVHFKYQGTDYKRYFDVINLQNYNMIFMILGTLFLYQHRHIMVD